MEGKYEIEELNRNFSDFKDIFSFNNYEFPAESTFDNNNLWKFKKFERGNKNEFYKFIPWFLEFCDWASFNRLTKDQVCTILSNNLGKIKGTLVNSIKRDNSIKDIFTLGKVLMRKLFRKNMVLILFRKIFSICKDYRTTNNLLIRFIENINSWIMISLSFDVPCCLPIAFFNNHILCQLPYNLRIRLVRKYKGISGLKVERLINIIDDEYGDLHFSNHSVRRGITVRGNNRNTNRYDLAKKKGVKCYYCGKEGHLRRNCSLKNNICQKCNKRGHLSNECKLREITNHRRESTETRIEIATETTETVAATGLSESTNRDASINLERDDDITRMNDLMFLISYAELELEELVMNQEEDSIKRSEDRNISI